jgi:phage tail-like protein
MTVLGEPQEFAHPDEFVVHIDDFTDSTWSTCGPLGDTIAAVVTTGAAGFRDVDSGVSVPKDLVLSRPLDNENREMYRWRKACIDKTADRIKNITIDRLNRDGTVNHTIVVQRAVITDYEGFSGDAKSSTDPALEKVTLAFKRWYIEGEE